MTLRRTYGRPRGRTRGGNSLLEEEVIPAIQQCLGRIDEIDGKLQAQQEAEVARLQAQRSAEIELALA